MTSQQIHHPAQVAPSHDLLHLYLEYRFLSGKLLCMIFFRKRPLPRILTPTFSHQLVFKSGIIGAYLWGWLVPSLFKASPSINPLKSMMAIQPLFRDPQQISIGHSSPVLSNSGTSSSDSDLPFFHLNSLVGSQLNLWFYGDLCFNDYTLCLADGLNINLRLSNGL